MATKLRKKIFILDDHPMTRRGLAQLINHEPDLEVCGEAENVHQALKMIPSAQPELVLADITMPGTSGIEFIKELGEFHPEVKALVVSMHDETILAERVLRAGGRGYVMKSEGGEKVLEAIRKVLQGEVYLSQPMATMLLGGLNSRRSGADKRMLGSLTDRELEVFQLIGQGYATMEISRKLHLSVKTIGTHRVHIKEKLNLKSSTELVKYAVGWRTTAS